MNLKDKVAIVTGGNSGIGNGHRAGTGAHRAPSIVIDYVCASRGDRRSWRAGRRARAIGPSACKPT